MRITVMIIIIIIVNNVVTPVNVIIIIIAIINVVIINVVIIYKARDGNAAHVLCLTNCEEAIQYLLVSETRVPDYCAAALNGLDDLGRGVTSQSEASRGRVELHRAAESLLRA